MLQKSKRAFRGVGVRGLPDPKVPDIWRKSIPQPLETGFQVEILFLHNLPPRASFERVSSNRVRPQSDAVLVLESHINSPPVLGPRARGMIKFFPPPLNTLKHITERCPCLILARDQRAQPARVKFSAAMARTQRQPGRAGRQPWIFCRRHRRALLHRAHELHHPLMPPLRATWCATSARYSGSSPSATRLRHQSASSW